MSRTVAVNLDEAIKRKRAFLNRQRAARENCKKSTGPKDCSLVRFNGMKHGLKSRSPIIPGEDPSELEGLRKSVYNKLKPRNNIETQLTEQVVFGFWRLQRGVLAEHSIMENHGDLERTHWDKVLELDYLKKISEFENHAARQIDRAFVALAQLRKLNYLAVCDQSTTGAVDKSTIEAEAENYGA